MGAWGAVSCGQTAAFAELGRRAIDNRLSPAATDLPPSAKTCHDLPRPVSFFAPCPAVGVLSRPQCPVSTSFNVAEGSQVMAHRHSEAGRNESLLPT